MLLGLVHMALRHWRHDQLLGLIGALLLAEAIGRLAPPPVKASTPVLLPAATALLVAIAMVVRFAVPLDQEPGAAVLATLDKLPAALRAEPVLNDYGFGAYLIAHGDRPFIDSRADLYGDAFLGRFREITELKPGALEAALRDFDIAWAIFPPDAPVLLSLERQPGWHRLLTDAAAVVDVRDDVSAR
jgi:Co/Zn/Cd efflux system component